MIDESAQKHTNLTTIATLILKEHRLERGIQQALLAERLGKTPSNFNKIESCKAPLTMDVFLAICNNLAINASLVMSLAESYKNMLFNAGWVVMSTSLPESDDELIKEANEYYQSAIYKNRGFSNIALNAPYLDTFNNNYFGIEVIGCAMYPRIKQLLQNNRVNSISSLLGGSY